MSRSGRRTSKPSAEMKMLAETIRVCPIKTSTITVTSTIPMKVFGNRKNFQEFRSVYEPTIKEILAPKADTDSDLSRSFCSIDPVQCPFRNVRDLPKPIYRDVVTPHSSKPVKTVRIQAPSQNNKNAIVRMQKRPVLRPRKTILKEYEKRPPIIVTERRLSDKNVGSSCHILDLIEKNSTHEFVEKLKQLEQENEEKSGNIIDEAHKEIDIASTQIEQIQSLLKAKLSKIDDDKNIGDGHKQSEKPKWNTKRNKMEDTFHTEKNKVLVALNTLNSKLQRMQDKYFKQPRIRYRSIADVTGKSVELIYKNRHFQPITPSRIDTIMSKSLVSPPLQTKPNTTDLRQLILTEQEEKPKLKVFEASNTCIEPLSESVLLDRKKDPKHFLKNLTKEICGEIPIFDTPRPYSRGKWSEGRPGTPLQKANEDCSSNSLQKINYTKNECKSPNSIKKTLMKSNYLAKELNAIPKALSGSNSPHYIPTFQEAVSLKNSFEIPDWRVSQSTNKSERERSLYENINAVLKSSLFAAPEKKD